MAVAAAISRGAIVRATSVSARRRVVRSKSFTSRFASISRISCEKERIASCSGARPRGEGSGLAGCQETFDLAQGELHAGPSHPGHYEVQPLNGWKLSNC